MYIYIYNIYIYNIFINDLLTEKKISYRDIVYNYEAALSLDGSERAGNNISLDSSDDDLDTGLMTFIQ